MQRRLSGLFRNEAGASILEFALAAPLLLAIIVAILQTSLLFLAQQGIETVAQTGSRLIVTGQAQAVSMTVSQFKTELCKALPPYMNCSKLMVDVKTTKKFSEAVLSIPTITYNSSGAVSNNFSYSTGAQGSIVVVRVMYLWPVLDGPMNFKLANQPDGNRLLMASSVLKSESY